MTARDGDRDGTRDGHAPLHGPSRNPENNGHAPVTPSDRQVPLPTVGGDRAGAHEGDGETDVDEIEEGNYEDRLAAKYREARR